MMHGKTETGRSDWKDPSFTSDAIYGPKVPQAIRPLQLHESMETYKYRRAFHMLSAAVSDAISLIQLDQIPSTSIVLRLSRALHKANDELW